MTVATESDIRIPEWLAKDNNIPQELDVVEIVAETSKAYR